MRTVWFLVGFFLLVTLGDHYTTWACLREPIPDWVVSEANPIAAWLFGTFGLVPGLVVDGIATLLVTVWIGRTKRISHRFKVYYLAFATAWTAFAVYHNYLIMLEMGVV